jgi:eukaryotic-like serine/threonine-protein kinase
MKVHLMASEKQDIQAIFNEAIVLVSEEARLRFLDQACGDDVQMRARAEALLNAHSEAGGFFGGKTPADDGTKIFPITEHPGTVIGAYKLLQQIGEGGMGVVFMAEQAEPIQRTVALKIIKPGMDTRQVIARFEAERQAVAMMDHPNIAKVLDAGTTDSGRPYFVMELVKGVPITKYCDDKHLPIRNRLELFIEVCQAVQHAHQKGIIHRDIKTNNVLVAEYDHHAVPKVIDFGVAKATAQKLTERTMFTEFGQVIGTVEYMSPEQAKFNQLDIDTRTDIYSLGVLLYELLTGTTPFERNRLREAAFDEALRIIREEEPPRPSTRFTTLPQQAASTIAEQRGSHPQRLSMLVRRELDWIAMKCLEKDRNRRYETANGLAADIERYLADEPVYACPPSASYRFRKFARRNRAVLTTATAVLVTIVLGLAASTYLIAQERDVANEAAQRESTAAERERAAAQDAQRERLRAEANLLKAKEAVDRLFTEVAERLTGEPQMEQIRRRLLEDALEFYQEFLKQKSTDPMMRCEAARAYLRVGSILNGFGQPQRGEENQRQAISLLEKLVADFPAETKYREDLALCFETLHYTLASSHQPHREEEYIEVTRRAVAEYEKLSADHSTVSKYRHQLASAYTDLGNALSWAHPQEAEKEFKKAFAVWKQIAIDFPNEPADNYGIANVHEWLGILLVSIGQYQEAETELLEALRLWDQLLAESPNRRGDGRLGHLRSSVGDMFYRTGRPAEAEKYYRMAVEAHQRIAEDFPAAVAEDHRRLAIEYGRLGWALFALGRTEEAEDTIRRGVALAQKLTEEHPGAQPYPVILASRYYDLGLLLETGRRSDEAAEAFRNAFKLFESQLAEFPGVPQRNYDVADRLSSCPATQFRNPTRAVELARAALQKVPTRAEYWRTLALAEYRAGNWRAARDGALKARQLQPAADDWDLFVLAMAQWQLGDKNEAQKACERAVSWMDKNCPWRVEVRSLRSEASELLGFREPKRDTAED